MGTLSFSQLGHSYLPYANPLSEEKIGQVIEICRAENLDRAIDIGAGNFYLLRKFVDGACKRGVGVELPDSPEPIALDVHPQIQVVRKDANIFVADQEDGSYDLALCIGSCHALGGYQKTLSSLKRIVRRGGVLVIGEMFWSQKPSVEYLKFLGDAEGSLNSHCDNLALGEEMGLIPLWAQTASSDEWDNYEWSYSRGIEDFFWKNPHHPQKTDFLERIKRWRNGVWKWGRDTLGFGLYLFRNTK